jgi:hypothetical protein
VILESIVVGNLETNCYIFGSAKEKEVVIIDPGGSPELILSVLYGLTARVRYISPRIARSRGVQGRRSAFTAPIARCSSTPVRISPI